MHGPAHRPTGYRLILPAAASVGAGDKTSAIRNNPSGGAEDDHNNNNADLEDLKDLKPFDIPGTGMFYQADECARCIRDGRHESEILTGEETVVLMEAMDQVRQHHGLVYPESVESC